MALVNFGECLKDPAADFVVFLSLQPQPKRDLAWKSWNLSYLCVDSLGSMIDDRNFGILQNQPYSYYYQLQFELVILQFS